MIELIASKTNIMAAFEWLCGTREGYRASDGVWDLRAHWQTDVRRYIGKTNKVFSFLGYFLQPGKRLQVAKKTLNNCANRISQLRVPFRVYEQGASKKRIGKYVRHFMAWAKGGFSAKLVSDIDVYSQLYSLLFDSPLDVPSINWKNKRKGEEKCEEYCLGYVPLG